MYERALADLGSLCPRLAAGFDRAHDNRCRWLSHFIKKEPYVLTGLDDLLRYIEQAELVANGHITYAKIRFLISRARLNVEAATEAALSGMSAVSFDLMRDLMEIEFLFRDFAADTEQVDRWLTADDRDRSRRFSPRSLRERHAVRLGVNPADLQDSADYKAHSQLLHVTPFGSPLATTGIEDAQMITRVLACFVEIFEHGRRIVVAAAALAAKLGLGEWPDPISDLKSFGQAWQQLQEFQAIYTLFIAPPDTGQ